MHVSALRYLVEVADEGSFGAAARRLHVTQPSVSQAIQRLEAQFDLTLLDRSGPRVVPTAEGAQVIEDVRIALSHLDRAHERGREKTSVATLRIGCTALAAIWWLVPDVLSGFGAAHPDIAVTVAEIDVPGQAEALLEGRLDMTIGEALPWHADLDSFVVGDHPCAVWMATTHPLSCHQAIELRMLEGVPIALGHPDVYPTYGPWVLRQLEDAGVPATVAPVVRDTPNAFRMILAGESVALAADMVSEEAMQGLAVRPVVDRVRWPWTVTLPRARRVPAADALVAWAQQTPSRP